MLQNDGHAKEASEIYRQVLKIDTDNIVAINNLAWILCEDINQFQQALELANQGLEIEPNNVDLLDTRAVALFRLGQLQRANEDLSKCVVLYPAGSPLLAASHLHLARVQAKLGQNNKAVDSIKKALDLNVITGGLSAAELAEAQKLLGRLTEGGI
jgi:tetratricopeptide (TPR) repeat protein